MSKQVTVYSQDGAELGKVSLSEAVFGVEPNKAVVHQYVVNYLANQRQGNSSTKGRAQVAGGGAKPWRQKGTGRARAGTIRSPLWRSGGITHGPKPRSYYSRFPKRLKKVAIRSVLSDKAQNNRIIALDKVSFDEIKTSAFVGMLDKLKVKGQKLLFVVEGKNDNAARSARNLTDVKYTEASLVNAYEALKADKLIFTKAALAKVEEMFA